MLFNILENKDKLIKSKITNVNYFANKFKRSICRISLREINLLGCKNKIGCKIQHIVQYEINNNYSLEGEKLLFNIVEKIKVMLKQDFGVSESITEEAFYYTLNQMFKEDTIIEGIATRRIISRTKEKIKKIIDWNPFVNKRKEKKTELIKKQKFRGLFNESDYEVFTEKLYSLLLSLNFYTEILTTKSYFFNPYIVREIIRVSDLYEHQQLIAYFKLEDSIKNIVSTYSLLAMEVNVTRWEYRLCETNYIQDTDREGYIEHYLYGAAESRFYNKRDYSGLYDKLRVMRSNYFKNQGIWVIDKIDFNYRKTNSILLHSREKSYEIKVCKDGVFIEGNEEKYLQLFEPIDCICDYREEVYLSKDETIRVDKYDSVNFNSESKIFKLILLDEFKNTVATLVFKDRQLIINDKFSEKTYMLNYDSIIPCIS